MIRTRARPWLGGTLVAVALAATLAVAAPATGTPTPVAVAPAPVTLAGPMPIRDPHIPAITPADCSCGGPGGSASLAHISPWNYSSCNYNVEVGRAGIHAYRNVGGTLTDVYVGWAQELYGYSGACRGYQWTAFHMIMRYVAGTTAAGGFTEMIWLDGDPLDWTTFAINYGGGQADGNFWSYAVLAGPLSTWDGIWTSLVHFVGRSDGLFVA